MGLASIGVMHQPIGTTKGSIDLQGGSRSHQHPDVAVGAEPTRPEAGGHSQAAGNSVQQGIASGGGAGGGASSSGGGGATSDLIQNLVRRYTEAQSFLVSVRRSQEGLLGHGQT